MRRIFILTGLLLLPLSVRAASGDIYSIFRQQVRHELTHDAVDDSVITFLHGVFRDRWPMSEQDIRTAIRHEYWSACVPEDDDVPQRNKGNCLDAVENITFLASEEQRLRTFGRTLQRIAAGQELPISEIPGRPFHMATDLSGIINIWRAGTGSIRTSLSGAMLLRAWTPAETSPTMTALRKAIDQLNGELSSLNNEEQLGVVARYQYGVRLVQGQRSPYYLPPIEDAQSGPGTERQYVFKRWETIEDILQNAFRSLPIGDTFTPPLSANEVVYVQLPNDLQQTLPNNLLLWLRIGPYIQGEEDRIGDAGLAWVYPLEPLLPSLVQADTEHEGDPILGGRYPPEPAMDAFSDENGNPLPVGTKLPVDGRGLCSMALAQRGYMCRSLKEGKNEACPESENQSDSENVIRLVSCTSDDAPTLTVAGADVCSEINWTNNRQYKCDVQFYRGECNGMAGMAEFKTPDGRINVCLNEESTLGPSLTYTLEHELVHAQQFCHLAPGNIYSSMEEEDADAQCCRLEGEAHFVSCKRMMEDGVLKGPNGGPLVINGIEITAQTCMEIARESSCFTIRNRMIQCPTSTREINADDIAKLYTAMRAGGNPLNLPDTFDESVNPKTADVRVSTRVRTIERSSPICTPGIESIYKNTIGNNACYIGQCAEETLELHRITGGRSPVTVGDEAFPWDDPNTGDALATTLRSVPDNPPQLPSYRPRMLMRAFEDALCQLQGLPAATPPHLCAFSTSRRLAVPLGDGASTALSMIDALQEQGDATMLLEELGGALGSRIGTDLQGQYLRVGTRSLSEIIALANTLLTEISNVSFPTNMCPLSIQ